MINIPKSKYGALQKESDISEKIAYGTTKTKALLTPWGFMARLGKLWGAGEN